VPRLLRRLARLVRLRAADDDLRAEMAHHRALIEDSFRERGLSLGAARDAANRVMGNETYMREESRAVWLSPWLESIAQDVRYAVRGLRRSPVFASVAVISLSLGLGANTAIFSLIHSLLLATVPVRAPEQLVSLQRNLGAKGRDERLSHAEFDALSGATVPVTMFASRGTTMDIDGITVNVSLDAVDGRYFDLLGIRAQRGRLLSALDNLTATQVVVITDRFWRGRLNADPGVLGRTVKIAGQPLTIVGVMPPRFAGLRFPAFIDVTVPYATATTLGILREGDSHRPFVTVVGRRGDNQSIETAQRELEATWSRCCATNALVTLPKSLANGVSQISLVDVSRGIPQVKLNLRGQYSRILLALMAGVGILLLAACANVANLLLARSAARTSELAVRLALGASRSRLVMQLLIESLLLSLLGAVGGWLLAQWGAAVLSRVNIGDLSRVVAPATGGSILLFTTAVSLISGMIFGVIPAVRVLRTDLITPMKQGGRRRAPATRSWLDRGLVAGQIALSLLLVSGATLLVETLRNLERADLGFDPANRFALTVETRGTSYERQGMTALLTEEMLRRVRAIPGVETAGFGSLVPVHGGRNVSDLVKVTGSAPLLAADGETWFMGVTPGYFASLGIPIVAGTDVDPPAANPSRTAVRRVVINQRFANKFFVGKTPIGQTFQDHDDGDTVVTENRVVGVVGDSKFSGLRVPAEAAYFVPVADHEWPYLILVVNCSRPSMSLGAAVSRAIAAVSPGIGIGEPVSLSASIDSALIRERMSAALATLFGLIALSLVAVGLYGVMLYQVTERTAELGIRMALGARRASVVALVLRQSLAIVGVGLGIGVPLAMLAGRAVATQLYGVAPYDVSALLVAAGSLVVVALAASLVPVRRAIGIDPISALRSD